MSSLAGVWQLFGVSNRTVPHGGQRLFRGIPVGTRYCAVEAKKSGATDSASAYRESNDTRYWPSQWHPIPESGVDKVSVPCRQAFANFDEDLPQHVLAGSVAAISPVSIILRVFNEHRVARRQQ